jgi:preprotein translocase subunit SecB
MLATANCDLIRLFGAREAFQMAKAAKPAPRKPAAKTTNGDGKRSAEKEPKISEGKSAGAVNLQVPPPQPGTQPSMRILGQYLKDLSFENPNAPQALAPQQNQPDINIAVNVNARNLAPTDFEVELHLDAKATSEGKVIFASELLFAGVFRMENFPANMLHAAVLIECPRMLFPFARQILADATRNGGFPPLMLDPIDFAGMYQKRMQQQSAARA